MPQLPTTIPTSLYPSTSHREFKSNYAKCHNHRWTYRRINRRPYWHNYVRWHLTESSKIITWNTAITDDHTDVIISIDNSSMGKFYQQKYLWNLRIPKGVQWMHLWPRQITKGITNGPRKIWRVIRNFGVKFKNCRRIFDTLPTDSIKIIIIFYFRQWIRW